MRFKLIFISRPDSQTKYVPLKIGHIRSWWRATGKLSPKVRLEVRRNSFTPAWHPWYQHRMFGITGGGYAYMPDWAIGFADKNYNRW